MGIRRQSTSRVIAEGQIGRTMSAAAYAVASGRPLTESVTIHLKQAMLDRTFVRRFFKLMNDWLQYRTDRAAAFIWVLESPPPNEQGHGGLHIHFLVHLPLPLRGDFKKAARRWVKLAGGQMKADVIKTRRVFGAESGSLAHYLAGLHGAVKYMMKGADPAIAGRYNIEPEYEGVLVGKRLGYSQSLGPSKRWQPLVIEYRPGIVINVTNRTRHLIALLRPALLGQAEEEFWPPAKCAHFP